MCSQYRFLLWKTFQATPNRFCVKGNQNRLSLTVFLHQSERFCIPAIVNMRWLDIKMPIDAHSLLARVWSQSAKDDGGQRDLISRGQLCAQREPTGKQVQIEMLASFPNILSALPTPTFCFPMSTISTSPPSRLMSSAANCIIFLISPRFSGHADTLWTCTQSARRYTEWNHAKSQFNLVRLPYRLNDLCISQNFKATISLALSLASSLPEYWICVVFIPSRHFKSNSCKKISLQPWFKRNLITTFSSAEASQSMISPVRRDPGVRPHIWKALRDEPWQKVRVWRAQGKHWIQWVAWLWVLRREATPVQMTVASTHDNTPPAVLI